MNKEEQNLNKAENSALNIADVSTSTSKPTPEKFGWHNQNGFDDEPSGWMFEGGEDAYYEALKKWEESQ